MACGQQVLHASCCLTHCSAPGGYNQGPSRYQKSAKLASLIHSTRKKAFRHNFFGPVYPLHVLREAEAGSPIKAVCAAHNISTATYHAWKRKFGGMEVSEAKRSRVRIPPARPPRTLINKGSADTLEIDWSL